MFQILIKIYQYSRNNSTHSNNYLGLNYAKTSPQLMSQRNTDRLRVTSFLAKYMNIYSQQIYTTTHKKKT
jgi:hypothetical protein